MTDNQSDAPIDLLQDVPADYFEWTPKDQDSIDQVLEANFSEIKKITPKKYTDEDMYKLISLVNRYPSGGHKGESFWNLMVKIYGDKLLEGRSGRGLRSRWKKVIKDQPNIEEYKKQLIASLPSEVIETIERKISEEVVDTSKHAPNSRIYAMLFPKASSKKKAYKRKLNEAELVFSETNKGNKAYLDLNLIVRERESKLIHQDNSVKTLTKIEHVENIVIVKSAKDNSFTVKDLREVEGIELCEKVDLERKNIFKGNRSKTIDWTELEDIVLQHPEYTDIYNQLIKLKGQCEVNKRKELLGMP